MYHHTTTESLYHLHVVKISWTPTLAGVSYQFGFFCFSICLQCKISGSTVFSNFFPHKVSHHKVRKLMGPSFWKKFRLAWLGGFKRSQSKVFRVFAKILIHLDMLFYFSTKAPMFFWRIAKTICLQKIWFLSYDPKTSKNKSEYRIL